jgi:hypothetical protein
MTKADTITTLYLIVMALVVVACLIVVEQRGYERGLREAVPDSIVVVDTLTQRPDSLMCLQWEWLQ